MVNTTRLLRRMIQLFNESKHATLYAHHRPTWPPQVAARVIQYASPKSVRRPDDLKPCSLLVDIGCGSGQSTPMYEPFCQKVIGLDPSEEQIKHAVSGNSSKNIEYNVGVGENIPLPNESVEIISCAQSAHWLNYDAFFKECRRVLIPRGSLAVYGYTMAEISVPGEKVAGTCNSLFQQFFSQCKFHPRRKHVDTRMSQFFSDLPADTKIRDDSFSIKREWSLTELSGYIQTWSGYRKLVQDGHGEELLNTLMKDILAESRNKDPDSTSIIANWSIFMILSSRPSPIAN